MGGRHHLYINYSWRVTVRIAIPIWKDKISPVLDTAARLLIIDQLPLDSGNCFEAHFLEPEISHRTKLLTRLNVDVLICGAISRPFKDMLTGRGVQVLPGYSGPIKDIVDAYFAGDLERSAFLMPGYEKVGTNQNQPDLLHKTSSKFKAKMRTKSPSDT